MSTLGVTAVPTQVNLERDHMVFKGWFKGASAGDAARQAPAEVTLEDLIVLERYDEAEARLKARLQDDPDDLHGHLKLAEVYTELGRSSDAVDQFIYVAEEYAKDGFYDKGIALLQKAAKVNPGEETLRAKLFSLERAKGLEYKREAAVEGLRLTRVPGGGTGTAVLRLERAWHQLATTPLIQRLSTEHLRRLFSAAEILHREEGERIAERGSDRAELWVPMTGTLAAVLVRDDGRETDLRRFGCGGIVGEGVLFERGRWPAGYRVVEPGLFLRLDRAGLEHALVGNSDPRGMIEALRSDGNDRDIADAVARLEGRAT